MLLLLVVVVVVVVGCWWWWWLLLLLLVVVVRPSCRRRRREIEIAGHQALSIAQSLIKKLPLRGGCGDVKSSAKRPRRHGQRNGHAEGAVTPPPQGLVNVELVETDFSPEPRPEAQADRFVRRVQNKESGVRFFGRGLSDTNNICVPHFSQGNEKREEM